MLFKNWTIDHFSKVKISSKFMALEMLKTIEYYGLF